MLKKLLNLVFVFVLIFNIGLENLTFADNDDAFDSQGVSSREQAKRHIDQCKKDGLGNIIDVNCAIKGTILDMQEFGSTYGEEHEIGPNKEYDIHLWTYNNIDNFYNDMACFIKNNIINLHKNNILVEALNTSTMGLKKFLNLSPEEASESFKKWIMNSKYIVNAADFEQIFSNLYKTLEIDNAEFAKVKEDYQKDYSKKGGIGGGIGGGILGGLGGLAAKGLTLAVAGTTAIGAIACAAICGGIGYWVGGHEGESAENERATQKAKKYLEDYNRFSIRTDVYANTIEQVLDKVNRSQWVSNDLLLAKLNFNPLYHRADTEFRKEGFAYDEGKVEENFKDLKQKLNELLENSIEKNKTRKVL